MSNSKEIKEQINIIKNTKKITHTMEMISAKKMQKAQKNMLASRPFAATIEQLITNVAYSGITEHPFLVTRRENNVGLLIISTDRGLCAGLNTQLFKKCFNYITDWQKQHQTANIKLATIGEKAKTFFGSKCEFPILASQEKIGDPPTMQVLIGVTKVLLQEYQERKIDRLYIAYNQFITSLKQQPIIKQLLPIVTEGFTKNKKLPTEYLFEPNAKILLDLLLDRYLESLIYQGVVENIASEHSARMFTMKNATDNAEQMIGQLHLHYNKERQSIITKEVAEIASGSTAITE